MEHIFFTTVIILSAGFNFIFSVYAKRYIDPLEYGIYSTCLILQMYMTYLQLGSMNAFNRDYPQLVGAKNHKKAREYRNTTFTFLLIIFGLAVAITVSILLILQATNANIDIRYSLGYLFTALLTALSIIESFGNYRARIDDSFTYSALVLLAKLFSLAIGIVLIRKIGYYALYLTPITSSLIGIVMFYRRGYSDLKLRVNWQLLKLLLLSGMPLLISNLIWTVVNTIDKFLILGVLDTEALGFYTLAQSAFSIIVLIPNALSQIFYVRMGREYGAGGSVQVLNKVANKFTSILAIISSFIAIGVFFLIPPFVELLIPAYKNGILSAQILVIGLAIYAPTMVNGNILTILKKNAALLRSSIYLCMFNVAFSMSFLFILKKDISSIAYGTATSYVLRSLIIVYQIKKYARGDLWLLFKSSILMVVATVLPAIALYNLIPDRIIGLMAALVLSAVIYAFAYRKELITSIKKGDTII